MMMLGPLVMVFGLAAVLLAVFVAVRFLAGGTGGNPARGCCGSRNERRNLEATGKRTDPLEIVRERYAQGEISHDELERYLGNLLPGEQSDR